VLAASFGINVDCYIWCRVSLSFNSALSQLSLMLFKADAQNFKNINELHKHLNVGNVWQMRRLFVLGFEFLIVSINLCFAVLPSMPMLTYTSNRRDENCMQLYVVYSYHNNYDIIISFYNLIESLRNYFTSFGEVTDCVVMRDPNTGRSRGFGFLTFVDSSVVNTVLVKEHQLDGKIVSS